MSDKNLLIAARKPPPKASLFRNVLVPKEAVIVLGWAFVIHANLSQYLVVGLSTSPGSSLSTLALLSFLFTPMMGYFGVIYARYRLLMVSVTMIPVFSIIFYALEIIQETQSEYLEHHSGLAVSLEVITGVISFLQKFGIQIFTANVIQFGIDQLHEAPSSTLAAFGRWYVAIYFIPISGNQLLSWLAEIENIKIYIFVTRLVVVSVVTVSTLPCMHFIFKKQLVIEPKAAVNPVKLIFGVLKYTWNHKLPARRSAFTYGEAPPSRIDQAKQRYGGPYTTEEVENVKSFWQVLFIVIVTMSFTLNHYKPLTKPYLQIVEYENMTLNAWEDSILHFPQLYRTATVAVFTIIFQVLYVPFFNRFIPSMLSRMITGLFIIMISKWLSSAMSIVLINELNSTSLCLTSEIMEAASTSNTNVLANTTTIMILFNAILNGIGMAFTYTASLEFIMAQAPLQMQGLIIGFWYIRLAIFGTTDIILNGTPTGCYIEYHIAYSCFLTGLLAALIGLACCYSYWKRNEPSDLNIRAKIEAVYEKNIENDYSSLSSTSTLTSIISIQETR